MSEHDEKEKDVLNIDAQTSEDEILTLLRAMAKKIKNAPVMNGGFDDLKRDVKALRDDVNILKAEQVKDSFFHERMEKDIHDVKDTQKELFDIQEEVKKMINEPEKGIYSKLKTLNDVQNDHKDLHSDMATSMLLVRKAIEPIEKTNLKLVALAGGEDLPALDTVVKIQKALTRIFWLGLTTALSVVGKLLYDHFGHFLF
jgi:hypothetical protein